MAHVPPKTVGSKSPTAKSSIFRSPAAVRIVVPFRKQGSLFWPGPGGFWPGPGGFWPGAACAGVLSAVKLAKIADPPIAPTFMRLRRDLRIPVETFSRADIFTLGTVSLEHLKLYYISNRVKQRQK